MNKNQQLLSTTKYEWQCEEGHTWKATLTSIMNDKTWCPYCSHSYKKTIKDMHNIAKKYNCTFISKKYVNNTKSYKWKCNKCGYVRKTAIKALKISKCSGCTGRKIVDIHTDVKKYGFTFLSKKYVNNKIKYKWKCNKCGYIRETNYQNLKKGGCKCLYKNYKKTIKDMYDIAKKYNYTFLSKKYVNVNTKYKWKCNKCGNIRICFYRSIKKCKCKMHNMNKIAKKYNYTFLSKKYVNSKTKYKWRCIKCGHIRKTEYYCIVKYNKKVCCN